MTADQERSNRIAPALSRRRAGIEKHPAQSISLSDYFAPHFLSPRRCSLNFLPHPSLPPLRRVHKPMRMLPGLRSNRACVALLHIARRFHSSVFDRDKTRSFAHAKDRLRTLSRRFRFRPAKEYLRAKRRRAIQALLHGEPAHHYAR